MELEIFFVFDEEPVVNPAAGLPCDHCPVKEQCLDWALEKRISHGVWGGTTPKQRRRLLVRKTRVHCPGCRSTLVRAEARSEVCISCGLTWLA
jgi:hypothetical protein